MAVHHRQDTYRAAGVGSKAASRRGSIAGANGGSQTARKSHPGQSWSSTGEGTPGQRWTRLPRPIAPPRKAGHRISARARRGARPTGCFWQRCVQCRLPAPKANASFPTEKLTANHECDERVQAQLRSFGWDVMVAWEHERRARYPGRGGGPARRAHGTAWAEAGSGHPSAPAALQGSRRKARLSRSTTGSAGTAWRGKMWWQAVRGPAAHLAPRPNAAARSPRAPPLPASGRAARGQRRRAPSPPPRRRPCHRGG